MHVILCYFKYFSSGCYIIIALMPLGPFLSDPRSYILH